MSRYADKDPECIAKSGSIEMLIKGRPRDLGDFEVSRVLPAAQRRMVGPFVFLDHIGPTAFEPGKGIDVRPHPHIGLATVTYLLEGAFMHRDSLGSAQLIEPGAVNWMTAGRGIVHSERTPPEYRAHGSRLHGIQSWVALPHGHEEVEPDFQHHPKEALPVIEQDGVTMRLIAGSAWGKTAPVTTLSPLFYLDATMRAGSRLSLPAEYTERALYPIDNTVAVDDIDCKPGSLAVLKSDGEVEITAAAETRLLLLGGEPLGERFIWWNLVSSSKERIETAKQDWAAGRFPKVLGDEHDFIPLPEN